MSYINHEEWTQENTLTSPSDRDSKNKFKLTPECGPLSDEETVNAVKSLEIKDFIHRFPRVERRYCDPPLNLQQIGLISFVPAKGATPNEQGIYGFAKLRGNFGVEEDASERAKYLVKNVDSYHKIYHTYVGRPFPLTLSSDFSAKVDEVELKKQTSDSISNNIRTIREDDAKVIREIEDREKLLRSDTGENHTADPLDHYITLRVKKAQLVWTYRETQQKLEEMKKIIITTREEINKLESDSGHYKEKYFQKYMDARRDSGLDKATHEDNFIKFMVDDIQLDF